MPNKYVELYTHNYPHIIQTIKNQLVMKQFMVIFFAVALAYFLVEAIEIKALKWK